MVCKEEKKKNLNSDQLERVLEENTLRSIKFWDLYFV